MELKMQPFLEIGKIINTYGIKGELKVIPLTDSPQRYYDLEWAFVGDDNVLEKYNIEKVRILKDLVIVKFKELNDINQAEKMKGQFIKVNRENAVKLPENTFFICDLINCEVLNYIDEKKLGTLKDIIQTGSNDVYIVQEESSEGSQGSQGSQGSEGFREILIPALKSVVKKVSVEEKKMWVSLPKGLVDHDF
ncbi:MAG TPA: ribosome maturation factor RimM [Clostridiales bacterium]|nr:ribosome maturation factor RimM [Clostridiales bacterium]